MYSIAFDAVATNTFFPLVFITRAREHSSSNKNSLFIAYARMCAYCSLFNIYYAACNHTYTIEKCFYPARTAQYMKSNPRRYMGTRTCELKGFFFQLTYIFIWITFAVYTYIWWILWWIKIKKKKHNWEQHIHTHACWSQLKF